MRIPILALTLLLGAAPLSAQDVPVDVPQNMDNPQGDPGAGQGELNQGEPNQGDQPQSRAANVAELRDMGMHGVDVEVQQDPLRIAPGEHGHLVLIVRLPEGRSVEKGGQVLMQSKQGPLQLGAPQWDPPDKGKNVYSGVIVIKIPLVIDAKASYGKPLFQGRLRLRGDFQGMPQPGAAPEIAADGGQADPAAPPSDQRPGLDPNRAELSFRRLVDIGPPMPKASRSQAKKKVGGSAVRAGKGPTGSSGDSAGGPSAAGGPADVVPRVGAAHKRAGSDALPESQGTEGTPELAEDAESGFPWWILSVALGLLAVLVFVAQSKKA